VFGYAPSRTSSPPSKLQIITLSDPPSTIDLFTKLSKQHDYAYLLESMEGPHKLAQYSFIGFDPRLVIRVKNGELEVNDRAEHSATRETVTDPLPRVKQVLEGGFIPFTGLRFIGGAVGYVSYDAIRYWEDLPRIARDDLDFPDIELAVYDDGVVFDHRNQTTVYYHSARDRSQDLNRLMQRPVDSQPLTYTEPVTNLSKDRFEGEVERAKEAIAAGDILQVVLSKRYEFTVRGDLLQFYRALRRINPSPYMYFLKMKDRQVVGSSPEMLVRVENGVVETYPIAGTRPRVVDWPGTTWEGWLSLAAFTFPSSWRSMSTATSSTSSHGSLAN